MESENETRCFFTGHRTIAKNDMTLITQLLDREIEKLISLGVTSFVCGGAVGFDTIAACRVAVAKKRHPELELILMLPCRDQTARWRSTYDISLYQRIKGFADEIVYAQDTYSDDCMHLRNRMMADMSAYCIAYYNNSRAGGTAYTVRYARERGIEVINLKDMMKMNLA